MKRVRCVQTLSNGQRRRYTRPPFAPKPVLDIRHIRQNPGLYEQNCVSRNYVPQARNSWDILSLHKEWTDLQIASRALREKNNTVRRQLANAASSPDSTAKTTLLEEARAFKVELEQVSSRETDLETRIESLALDIPNLSSQHTPSGSDPVVREYINDHPETQSSNAGRTWQSHVHIGSQLQLFDFAASATTSGWGWYFLLNEAVLLEQALIQYALSIAREHGWSLVTPPSIVYSHIASACGFLPRDANGETQIYNLSSTSSDTSTTTTSTAKPTHVLAGTAEIPLAGMRANSTIPLSSLPLKAVGTSRCYRAEAGARGVDTKGLYRVHEFTKVEMFAWTAPDASSLPVSGTLFELDPTPGQSGLSNQEAMFEEMLSIQRRIVGGLGLHARVLEMPATDLGASASRKVDIEAWFPSRRDRDEGWGEVSSLSMCGDYQARRLGTRVKMSEGKGGQAAFAGTLNGTALAVPRVLAAVLEMGWDEQRELFRVPEVLWKWMDGVTEIKRQGP